MKKQTASNYPIWKIGSILYEGIKMLSLILPKDKSEKVEE